MSVPEGIAEPDVSGLFPRGVQAGAKRVARGVEARFEVEAEAIARAVQSRRDEFLTGRELTRELMGRLGVAPAAIPVGPRRVPLWPEGVVGSIAHAGRMCVAALAFRTDQAALGIDIEPNEPLESDVLDAICSKEEREDAARRPAARDADASRLIFSAKECIFKTLFPLAGIELEFAQVRVWWDAESASFRVGEIPPRLESLGALLRGAYRVTAGWIVTGAWLEPPARRG